jgi:hypothetical protein
MCWGFLLDRGFLRADRVGRCPGTDSSLKDAQTHQYAQRHNVIPRPHQAEIVIFLAKKLSSLPPRNRSQGFVTLIGHQTHENGQQHTDPKLQGK